MGDDDQRPAAADGTSSSGATAPPARSQRARWILIGAVVLVVISGGLGAWVLLHHRHQVRQVVLPFPGVREPYDVAVDTAGNVYIADANNTAGAATPADANTNRVLKLPAGSGTPFTLPFTGLKNPSGVAVDAAGVLYVADANTPGAQTGGGIEHPDRGAVHWPGRPRRCGGGRRRQRLRRRRTTGCSNCRRGRTPRSSCRSPA